MTPPEDQSRKNHEGDTDMTNHSRFSLKPFCWFTMTVLLLMMATGCSQVQKAGVKKIPAGKEFTGFLKDYKNLKPVQSLEGTALGYANADAQKNLHKYIACVIDPVDIYLATDADDAKYNESNRFAVAEYYRAALVKAVSGAFPVVEKPGPLVLRLRSAIVGVDFGGELAPADKEADKAAGLTHMVNIGKVQVEMELVDSETGEQIAAFVDKENLAGEAGSAQRTRKEEWAAAREAFDGWAARVRQFLDASHERSPEDAERAVRSYRPYGSEPDAK